MSHLFVALGVGALFAAVIQVLDSLFSVIDAVTVRDIEEPDALTRRRYSELTWSLAVTATLAVLVAFGVDAASRLIWESTDLAGGLWVLIGSAFAAFAAGMTGVLSILGRERPTYARIRRDLRDRSSLSIDAGELAEFEDRLARADRAARRRPTVGIVFRVGGAVFVIAVAVALAIIFFLVGSWLGWAAVCVAVVDLAAVLVAIVAGSARRTRLSKVYESQRAEVVALLERARIPQRGRVPGLRDRVARALAILREKQR